MLYSQHIGICHTGYVDCLLAMSGWNSSILTSLADSQHNQYDKYQYAVNTALTLLMMDSRSVRNM